MYKIAPTPGQGMHRSYDLAWWAFIPGRQLTLAFNTGSGQDIRTLDIGMHTTVDEARIQHLHGRDEVLLEERVGAQSPGIAEVLSVYVLTERGSYAPIYRNKSVANCQGDTHISAERARLLFKRRKSF